MPTDPQPEEAATRPLAAAASAAGSFTQTQMYGRGWRQRPDPTMKEPDPTGAQETTESPRPSAPPVAEPSPQSAASSAAAASRELDAAEEGPTETPNAGEPPAGDAVPVVSDEVLIACSEQDAAAARARLVQGQQVEPPPVAPPAPGLALGL
ncbi:MAG: hypothetical protein ACJ74U_15375 [Jatrophihabitantaceae bacterium]